MAESLGQHQAAGHVCLVGFPGRQVVMAIARRGYGLAGNPRDEEALQKARENACLTGEMQAMPAKGYVSSRSNWMRR